MLSVFTNTVTVTVTVTVGCSCSPPLRMFRLVGYDVMFDILLGCGLPRLGAFILRLRACRLLLLGLADRLGCNVVSSCLLIAMAIVGLRPTLLFLRATACTLLATSLHKLVA